jgi:hypothetical protein
MLEYLYFFFELAAFLVAILQFSRIKNTRYVFFIPYLVFILIYEFGSIKNWFLIEKSNLWITNLTLILFFLYYTYFLIYLIQSTLYTKWIKRCVYICLLFSIINLIFIQGFWNLNSITILLQFVILITSICLYFYELMNYSAVRFSISKMPGFWLNAGLLFFCLAEFLFYSAFAYMAYHDNYTYYQLFELISNTANIILYTCLIISFLCFSKKKDSAQMKA